MANYSETFEQGREYLAGLAQTTQNKTEQLQQAKQDKLTTLSNNKPVTITGYDDADTFKTADATYRLTAPDGSWVDAVEGKHGDKPIDMYGGTGAYQKAPKAMDKQRELVARMVGKPVDKVEEQDFVDVSNWQLVQQMSDQLNGPGVWEAPFGRETAPLNMSGKFKDVYGVWQEAPLNIPATVQTAGKDKAGRTLAALGTAEGIDATTVGAHDKNRNIYATPLQVTEAGIANDETSAGTMSREDRLKILGDLYDSKRRSNDSVIGRAANVGEGALAMAAKGLYDVADLGAEMFGSDLGTEEEKTHKINKAFGYNDKYTAEAGQYINDKIADMRKNGITWDGVWDVIKKGLTTFEFFGESIGFVADLAIGGEFTAGAKAVKAATKVARSAERAVEAANLTKDAAKIEKATENLAKATSAVNDAKKLYTPGERAIDFLTNNAGLFAVSAGMANDDLDDYAKEAGLDKKDIPLSKKLGSAAIEVVANYIDKVTDLGILKSPEIKDSLVQIVKGMTTKQAETFGRGLAKAGATMGIGAAKEGSTEYVQQFLQQISQQVGEDTGKTVADAWNDEKNEIERLGAGAVGAISSQHMAAASVGTSGLLSGVSAGVDKVRGEISKIRAEKDAAANADLGVSVEDRLAKVGSMMETDGSSLAEVQKHLNGLAADVDGIDDLNVKQSYIDANKAYQERLSTYAKEVETTGKLDSRSYGAEPEFYLDMLAAATDKEAIAKAIENDAELKKNYGEENVQNLAKTLLQIDTSRNTALDELVALKTAATGNQTMEGTKHDVANLGFATTANVYPSLAEYVQESFRTGKVDPRLIDFTVSQEDKLERVKAGYAAAKSDVKLFINSIATSVDMSDKDVAKGLAYLEGRTAKGGKVNAEIGRRADYVKLGAKLLGMNENSSWEAVSEAYKTSQLKKDVANINLADVGYANMFIGRNEGRFQFNTYEIIGDVAQDLMTGETDKLGVSGAQTLIAQVEKEVATLKKVVGRAAISAKTLDMMKQTYRMYQNEKGQVVTGSGEVVETVDGPDADATTTGSTDGAEANADRPVDNKEKLAIINANKELLTPNQQKQLRSLPVLFDDVADNKIDKLYNKVQKELNRKVEKEQKAAARKERAEARAKEKLEAKAKAAANKRQKTNVMKAAVSGLTNEDGRKKAIETALKIKKDNTGLKGKYTDEDIEYTQKNFENSEEGKAALEQQQKEIEEFLKKDEAKTRIESVVEAVEDHATDPTVDNTVDIIAKVDALVADSQNIEEYDVEDVEDVLKELQGSEFVARIKELTGNNEKADTSEEAKAFYKIVIKAAAEERVAEMPERDAVRQLKMQKVRVGKAIEKVKGLVDRSKVAVGKAFDAAKRELAENRGVQKQLENARAELHRKTDIAKDARRKLDEIKAELAKKTAELAKAKDEADAVFEINKELAKLHYKTVGTLKAAVKKLVANVATQEKIVNSIDTVAVESEIANINKTLAELMKRRDMLDKAKTTAIEQKRLANTALSALVDEARVIREALKMLKVKYSNTDATKKVYQSGRAGFSSSLKAKNKDGNVTASIKLSDFVEFAKDGNGSRISSVGARAVMYTDGAQKALKKLVDNIKKVVANPSMIEELNEGIVANASSGTILLINLNTVKDSDGKPVKGAEKPIDENAALALKMAMMEAVEAAAMTSMDDSDLERIYGEANVDSMSYEQKQAMLEMGLPTKYMSSKIGKIAMKLLGLTKKYDENGKQINAEQYERLEMSLGRFGVRLAEIEKKVAVTEMSMPEYLNKIGLTEEAEKANKEATMSLVKVAKTATVEAIRTEYDMWNNYVLIVDKDNDVVFEKPRNVVLKQSNNEATDMPLEAQANMEDMMKQEWHLKGVDDETSAMHDLLQMSPEELMLLEGYDSRVDSEDDSKYLPEQLQKTIKGQNLSVRKAVEGMKGLANKILSGLEKNSFWHRYSFAKSGRSFVDSDGFNGQGTKLHRHMLFSKQQTSNVSLDKESSDYQITMLAIAQNMGQDTDKLGLSESVKLGETLLGAQEQLEKAWAERKAAVKEGKVVKEKMTIDLGDDKSIVVKAVPVSAFADALDAIRAINAAIAGDKQTVALTMTLEADGITNGFALKMLQVMWSLTDDESVLVTEWLEKTGIKIWDKDSKGSEATGDEGIAGLIGAGKLIDSYRTLATDMTEDNVNHNIMAAISKRIKREASIQENEDPDYTDPVLDEIVSMFGQDKNGYEPSAQNASEKLKEIFAVATNVFGALTGKDGVTSFARSLMKPPFMTFMYGAGDMKMMSELAGSLIDELLIKLSTYHTLEEDSAEQKAIDALLETLFPDVTGDRVQWIINYRSGATDIDGNGVDPINVMRVAFMNTYGAAAVGILKEKFKPLVKINKQIRSAMALVADVWAVAYKNAVEKLANGKVPTKDQYMQALEDTKHLFPVIKGPFSSSREDGIAIFKKKLASGIASQFAINDTELSAGMVRPGQSSAYVKEGDTFMQKMVPLLTHIYVEAATAAAVIPIHTLDGAIMSRAIKGKGVMQIFDAIMLGISQAVGIVKDYNKTLFDVSMNWHYLDNVLDAVEDTILKVQDDERLREVALGAWEKYGKEIKSLQVSAKKSRETKHEVQKRGVTVSNMLLVKDSEYLVEPKQKTAIIDGLNKLSVDEKTEIAKAAGKDFDTLVQEIKENC